MGFSKIIMNPNYEKATAEKPKGDIGLIKLSEPLKFGAKSPIAPICMETVDNFKEIHQELFLTGWGKVLSSNGKELKNTNLLHEGSLKQIKFEECKRTFKGVDPKEQICAGDRPGDNVVSSASESGDSGSPLSVIKDGKFYQVGLTSYGVGSEQLAIKDAVTVFERTNGKNNWNWIKKTVTDGKWCK